MLFRSFLGSVLGSHGVGFGVPWGGFWGPIGSVSGSHGVGFGVPYGRFRGPMGWVLGSRRVVGALGVGEGLKEGSNGVPKNVFGVS